MLTVEGLRSRYGRIEVLHGVDLFVGSGEIVTVVGANGAGKTTLLRCLSGVQPVSGGTITFRGEALAGVPALVGRLSGDLRLDGIEGSDPRQRLARDRGVRRLEYFMELAARMGPAGRMPDSGHSIA